MVSIAQKIFGSLFGKKKDRILHDISEEDINKSKKVKAQSKYIQSLEAQISKRQAQDRLKKVEKKDFEDEVDLIKQLEEKEEEIKTKKYKNSFDLFKIPLLMKKNKKFKVELTDKDDNTIFDALKTFLILKNGDIAIQGESGEVWAEGPTLRHIIHKPESIRNQIRRKRILLPYDENFKPLPDLENMEIPEMSYDIEDGKWNISEERIKKVKDMIIERDEDIRDLRDDKKKNEQTIADLRNKVQDLELAKDNWKKQTENSQAELSVALANEKEMSKNFVQLDRDLTVAQDQKGLADNIKEKYDEALKEIIEELEDEKAKTKLKRARLEIWKDIKRARKLLPKEVPEEKTEEKEETKNINK